MSEGTPTLFQYCSETERAELLSLLGETYKPEGVDLWIAHAERQGWSYETCLSKALAMAEGNFS